MLNNYGILSDEELDKAMNEVTKKMLIADSLGKGEVLQQLQVMLDNMREEHKARTEFSHYEAVDEKIPSAYVIGEDNDTDAPADKNDEDNSEFHTRRYRRRIN